MTRSNILKISILSLLLLFSLNAIGKENQTEIITNKKERNYIREGNKLYNEKRFSEAEIQYRKALEEVPTSETALFNLAASLIRQSGSTDVNAGNNPISQASQVLKQLANQGYNIDLSEKSFYNLGNIAFNQQDYSSSIQLYKNALRKNPNDDKARQNLRIAQKMLQEQKNNQNQDQDNKDQENQDQQKEQNENKQDQQNQDQQNQQNQQDKQDNQNKEPNQSMSNANAEKILKAMENEEAATRKRVEAEKKKAAEIRKKKITNPW